MQIDLNKKYKTRSGLEVTDLELSRDLSDKFPIRGKVKKGELCQGNDVLYTWSLEGHYFGGEEHHLDLVEAPERIRKPEPKWEVGPVKLVNGWDATIYRHCDKRMMYIGEMKDYIGWFHAAEWYRDGQYRPAEQYPDGQDKQRAFSPENLNLAPPVKKKVQLHKWVNVYEDGSIFSYPTKKEANDSAGAGRFALIEIDREVEEGEGLDLQTEHDANSICNK